jgi:hypothetical protein
VGNLVSLPHERLADQDVLHVRLSSTRAAAFSFAAFQMVALGPGLWVRGMI